MGQNYNRTDERIECIDENMKFNATIINALLYENCIEDTEISINLNYQIGNKCDNITNANMFIYNRKLGDILYILQNGSLLLIDSNLETGYNYHITNNYCVDMDHIDKILTAIICIKHEMTVTRGESLIYAVCLLISVPCLFLTAFLYIWIDDLRDLHGKSLACHSICLAIGFIFLASVQISGSITICVTYFIQYFMLACYLWLAALCADVCTQVWYCLPKNRSHCLDEQRKLFIYYSIIAFILPLIPVLFAYINDVAGIPLYYLKGIISNIPNTHTYFLPPIAFILTGCTGLLGMAYYGFMVNQSIPLSKESDEIELRKNLNKPIISYERYYEALRL